MLFSDVTSCVTSLKKVVQEATSKVNDARLQLAQPAVRPAVITVNPDSRTAHIVDFDAFVTDWDEYLNIARADITPQYEDDGDFNPSNKQKTKKKGASGQPVGEKARKEQHTLEEHHEHLLSLSFDTSFVDILPAADSYSSQKELAIDFDQTIFDFSDGMELGDVPGLGDDLAREIGWVSPENRAHSEFYQPLGQGLDLRQDFNFDVDMPDALQDAFVSQENAHSASAALFGAPKTPSRKLNVQANKENEYPGSIQREKSISRELTPGTAFATQLLNQDEMNVAALQDITHQHHEDINQSNPASKKKRTRLLLDARTELTDDELKIARARYLEHQNNLRKDVLIKRAEKYGNKLIDEFVWAAPKGIADQGLAEFWQSTFKVQVDAKTGALFIHPENDEEPTRKRRRTTPPLYDFAPEEVYDYGEDAWMGMGPLLDDGPFAGPADRASSEDPGQGRRVSRPSSVFGEVVGVGEEQVSGSQRSSLFPWDHAGAGSSSSGNVPFKAMDDVDIRPVDVDTRVRGSSRPRHSSIPGGSQQGRAGTPLNLGVSPIPFHLGSPQQVDQDYEFNVPLAGETQPEETQEETQREENPILLEKNSLNFLEYARMQSRTLPDGDGRLSFDKVVPPDTSTRNVAAAAFHHCLVLATKNLLRVEQENPYGTVFMRFI